MGYFDRPIPPEVHTKISIRDGEVTLCDACKHGYTRIAWDQAHPEYPDAASVGYEYRIEFTYPYLESINETRWAGVATSLGQADRFVHDETEGYGRRLTVQKRTVVRYDWETINKEAS